MFFEPRDCPRMLPDDTHTPTHNVKLQQLIASLRAWTGFVADVARVEVSEVGSAWRVSLQPKAANACPLEILLDSSGVKCDIRIAAETYHDWLLPSLDIVLPLIEAVAEGRVVTRHTTSAVTGLPLSVATLIKLADGRVLETSLENGAAKEVAASAIERRDTHYLPYRRPGVHGSNSLTSAARR